MLLLALRHKDGMKLISSSGKIVLNFHAKQLNIVAAGDNELEILIDGKMVESSIAGNDVESSMVRILEPRLYNIIESFYGESHTITINVKKPNFEILVRIRVLCKGKKFIKFSKNYFTSF